MSESEPENVENEFVADEIEPTLGEIYALLVAQNELLQRYIDVIEQVGTEIGPVVSSLSKSPILKMLGGK